MKNSATLAELSRTSPLTWEQRDRLLFATGKMLSAEIDRGASPVAVRPLFNLLCTLAKYQPAGKPPKAAGLPRGRPSKPISLLFPSKSQKRAMAKRRRPYSAGQRGPVAGSDHEALRPADARRIRAMVEYMAKHGVGEYAAANTVLRTVFPLSEVESGDDRPDQSAALRRLTRAYKRFGYAVEMVRYQQHRKIQCALQRGDIPRAKAALGRNDTD